MKRVIGKQSAGNRRLSAECDAPLEPGWSDRDDPTDTPDRNEECSGCASLTACVAALQVEVESLAEAYRQQQELIANLNARLEAAEWSRVRDARQRLRLRRLTDATLREIVE